VRTTSVEAGVIVIRQNDSAQETANMHGGASTALKIN